ncbi:GlsB/YeaQ/YmgE family stress response membrane protein [Bosea sp. NBC_00550]|uniref:GlsB/YeaQ/YmgE family stress response membrane protein n=1 Tax=Bosea sp. NBC_00550 TaxID=2969621 RepID=UPI00222FC98F|nr:GlsB/YeaQ/YmgE family stress response membrane protein [Bosea sp. NBC_00550]UZF93655.1 GlsB/YeaQ/YmgE family stress response membrane protein [Bosea sp. NBC_00550]
MQTLDHLIVWIIIGVIGGSLAGLVIKWDKRGFGLLRNLAVGLIGAVIGGLLFRWLQLLPSLDGIAISLRDVIAAFVGSLIVLVALWAWRRFGGHRA